MRLKLSRIFLIIMVVFLAAIYLPHFYWMASSPRIYKPSVYYSPVLKKFLTFKYDGNPNVFCTDSDGKTYTRRQTDKLLPFMNYRLLAAKSAMPDSVNGTAVTLEEVRLNNFLLRTRPHQIDIPQIPLYPLFESQPERLQLEIPQSFFRITGHKMEFINTKTNEQDKSLTEMFTKKLVDLGFAFPAKGVYGNPTTRKAFDEGYFIVDSNHFVYHVKMIKGKPFCVKTSIPNDIRIRKMIIKEMVLKEFYGYIITEDNRVFFIMYDNYKLQQIPSEGYDQRRDHIFIVGNLLYRTISYISTNSVRSLVLNRKYELVDRYETHWKDKNQLLPGIVASYIFPFTISTEDRSSYFNNIFIKHLSYNAVYLNLFLLILLIAYYKKSHIALAKNWLDLIFVIIFGIFGFIAVLIFKSEDVE